MAVPDELRDLLSDRYTSVDLLDRLCLDPMEDLIDLLEDQIMEELNPDGLLADEWRLIYGDTE